MLPSGEQHPYQTAFAHIIRRPFRATKLKLPVMETRISERQPDAAGRSTAPTSCVTQYTTPPARIRPPLRSLTRPAVPSCS
ncbi:hypothetical protein KCP75_16760 [Salmonella enterica subsp. enterica]|nr:hypothetical protein KCP75_16760 [Salmonella enterica subsp. enterica]